MSKQDQKMHIAINEDEIIKEIMLEYPDIHDALHFDEYNVKEKLEKNQYLYQQYRLLALKESHNLKRIEILMDEYIGQLYDSLKFGDKTLSKTEIEKYYINKDEKVVKFKKMYMRQAIRVETFEAIVKAFDKQTYNMQTYVKNLSL